MSVQGAAGNPPAAWRAAITRLEGALAECLARDAERLAQRLAGLRRRLAGRGRRWRGGQITRVLRECEQAVERSRAVRAARAAVQPRLEFPPELPFSAHAATIARLLEAHQVLIVSGETGCGKSTQLPKLCLGLGRGVAGRIGHTQPRRIAARAIARRVAEETATREGELVGHCVRFDDNVLPQTRVKVMTDGILLNEIHADPRLLEYDTLIIDEVHERSLNVDFLLGYLKPLLVSRPELKLILTSATLDAGVFERFFPDAVSYTIPDRSHPIEIRYRPPAADEEDEVDVDEAILAAIHELDAEARGDVLVFLPGEREIRGAALRLSRARLEETDIFTLYARLSAARQARIFSPGPRRRIILATNVAETSLTVPRVRHVIDTGLARISRYSPRRKLQQLPVEKIPRANADQRAGRCGRESAGICVRLYGEADYLARRARIEPEVQRTNLAGVVLKLKAMGVAEVESFPFAEPPGTRLIKDAYLVLQEVGALDAARELTALGQRLARFPVDPRLARVLDAAAGLGCLSEALVIVAALSIADPRERPHELRDAADRAHALFSDKRSDFLWFLRAWPLALELRGLPAKKQQRLCRRRFLSATRMVEWVQLHEYLSKVAADMTLRINPLPASYKIIHTALAAGFPSQVGLWADDHYAGCRGASFQLHPSSVLARRAAPWVVAAEVLETRERYARIAARLESQWLEQVADHLIKRSHEAPHWDRRRGCVRATEIQRLYGLVINDARLVDYQRVDPLAARAIFIDVGLLDGELGDTPHFLGHNQALLTRVRALEARARRRDLVLGRTELAAFLDARLPPGIATRRDLLAWLRTDACHDATLCMQEADITSAHFGSVQAWLFPDVLAIGGTACVLEYRFEPGHPHDGLALHLPQVLLTRLRPEDLDRLVPGLLSEKVTALLRALPKAQRRLVSPIREFAMAAVEALTTTPGPLPQALAAVLTRVTGLPWSPAAFDDRTLEPHLRCLVRLLDAQGAVLEETRDIDLLFGAQGVAAKAASARIEWGLAGQSRGGWRFADLPESVTAEVGGTTVVGYPALCATEQGVRIEVLDEPGAAREIHARGVARLLSHDAAGEMRRLARDLPGARELGLYAAMFGYRQAPLEALVRGAARRWLCEFPAPRGAAEYARARDAFVAGVADAIAPQARALLALFERAHGLRGALARVPAAVRADLQAQLMLLLGPAAVDYLDLTGLHRAGRALDAVERRLERVESNPGKDLRKLELIEPYARRLHELYAAGRELSPDLRGLQLMLEDYRVSVFAPELGAASRVSASDIEARLALLEAPAQRAGARKSRPADLSGARRPD